MSKLLIYATGGERSEPAVALLPCRRRNHELQHVMSKMFRTLTVLQ